METSLIYIHDEKEPHVKAEDKPFSLDELAKKTIVEAKKKAVNSFKEFKNEFDFQFARQHLTFELKVKMAEEEMGKIGITYQLQQMIKGHNKLKDNLIQNIKSLTLKLDNYDIIWQHQYDNGVRWVADVLLSIKKEKYLTGFINEPEYKPAPGEKLIFLGRPVDFAVLINDLVTKAWVQAPLPKRGPKENYKRQLAILCHSLVYIPNLDGTGETSVDNLYEEIKHPSLSNAETAFFEIKRKNRK
jgi:hypothetical protein